MKKTVCSSWLLPQKQLLTVALTVLNSELTVSFFIEIQTISGYILIYS